MLWALHDYLDELIIIGGWVPALYQLSGTIPSWRSSVSRTKEVDVLIGNDLPRAGRRAITEILTREHFVPIDAGPSFAIWSNKEGTGDRVEFLTPHRGTYAGVGRVCGIRDQDCLGAIQLPELEMLSEFVNDLDVGIESPAGQETIVRVRVTTLGAFLVSRGAIFLKRSTVAGKVKPGKDLVYIHDVLAGGDDVVACVTDDLGAMVGHSSTVRDYLDYSANNIKLALSSRHAALDEAAQMLVERESKSRDSALAAIGGYLTDFLEMVQEAISSA